MEKNAAVMRRTGAGHICAGACSDWRGKKRKIRVSRRTFCSTINLYLIAATETASGHRMQTASRSCVSLALINARKMLKLILPMPLLASASWTRLTKRDCRSDPIYPASLEVPVCQMSQPTAMRPFLRSEEIHRPSRVQATGGGRRRRLDGKPKAKLIVLTAVH